jgi:carboxyl-terminal processing protease
MNPEDFAANESDMSGEYYGIGVSVLYSSNYNGIEVITVFPDSPAMEAGVLPGDLIMTVNGISVAELGYLEAVNLMRGEEGTLANFTVYRGPNYSEEVSFSIPRGKVTEMTVSWEMYSMAKDVAVIKIYGFDDKTPAQFYSAINSALSAGAKGFVYDVRSNPGGGLGSVCEILDFLLPAGPIIRIDYKGESRDTSIPSNADYFDFPSVVLCNQYTASAGELFSSAMQDYGIAKLVGVTTYGKGTMQTMLELSDGSGIAVTCAYYLPPKSPNYHGVGVVPDVVVEMPEEFANTHLDKLTDEQDIQLQAAVATLFEAMNGSNKGDGTLT